MFKKSVFPGKYIQGNGAIRELPNLVGLFGRQGLILASPTVRDKILPACGMESESRSIPVELFRGECCESEIVRLSEMVREKNVDVLVGMGGGKLIDTAKIVADETGIAVIIVPTIASTDAPCSGCAVQYTQEGVFVAVHYQKANPAAVLVDTAIIAAAPTRFLVAGMGDALATWFEARSCDRTQSPNECGGYTTAAGLSLARLCYDTVLAYGLPAKIANDQHVVTPAFERIVEANILLSGIGFESAGLAAAHGIHNGLTALEETHAVYHGEKVAFGVLAGLQLTDAPVEEWDAVYAFCESVGLPTTLADININAADRSNLMKAAEKTCDPASSVHHETGMITPEKVLNAMIAADAIGKRRKNDAQSRR